MDRRRAHLARKPLAARAVNARRTSAGLPFSPLVRRAPRFSPRERADDERAPSLAPASSRPAPLSRATGFYWFPSVLRRLGAAVGARRRSSLTRCDGQSNGRVNDRAA